MSINSANSIASTNFANRVTPYSTGSVEHYAYCAGWQDPYRRAEVEQESPLSGEWADGPNLKSIVVSAWIDAGVSSREAWMHANDDWEDDSSILDAWEEGYRAYFEELGR